MSLDLLLPVSWLGGFFHAQRMHTESALQADQPFNESIANHATQGRQDVTLGASTDLAEEEKDPSAPQQHNRHADMAPSDHSMQASSAHVASESTQQSAKPGDEESLLMQRRDSQGSASTSGATQSSSSSSGGGGNTRPTQDSGTSSGVQGGGSDARSSYNSSTIWRASSIDQEAVNSNATGMQISFLGTASSINCRSRFCLRAPSPPPAPVLPKHCQHGTFPQYHAPVSLTLL